MRVVKWIASVCKVNIDILTFYLRKSSKLSRVPKSNTTPMNKMQAAHSIFDLIKIRHSN